MKSITLCGFLLMLASSVTAADTPRPFVFGINAGASRNSFEVAKAAGCTCVRIGCGWDLVEPVEGQIDWREPDKDVELCREFGFEPFFLIVATPKWALAPEKRDKPWGWAPEPEFYPQARRFYKALAERYRGKVRYYEFWNEPNGYGWHEPGKPEEYAPILKVAYEALKEGDPNCQVAVGGLDGSGWKGYYQYLEKLYDLGCGDSFDAVAVHPYRKDGPIDVHGLRKVREVLLKHGHGGRKLWLTEYGWSNEYGHENKAKWLKQSLDILTSPEMDYVFQASIHTINDFDGAEYGMCTRDLRPRWAYQVFRDYPKDWDKISAMRRQPGRPDRCGFGVDGFEDAKLRWTPYGGGARICKSGEMEVPAESGRQFLASPAADSPSSGGVTTTTTTEPGVPVRLEARIFTNDRCGKPSNARSRVGIDPTGGTDPGAATVVWSRWMDTAGMWDTIGVGQVEPIVPKVHRITAFLEYKQTGGQCQQVNAFDSVSIVARDDGFELPEVKPVITKARTYEPAEITRTDRPK